MFSSFLACFIQRGHITNVVTQFISGFLKRFLVISMGERRTTHSMNNSIAAMLEFLSNELESIQKRALRIIYPSHSYLDALNITNLSSLKERRTQLCRKYIQKMSQNDHPINFLKPRTATSGHSYNLQPGGNNRNNVYADRSCCRTQRSGSFISFASKYVNM